VIGVVAPSNGAARLPCLRDRRSPPASWPAVLACPFEVAGSSTIAEEGETTPEHRSLGDAEWARGKVPARAEGAASSPKPLAATQLLMWQRSGGEHRAMSLSAREDDRNQWPMK